MRTITEPKPIQFYRLHWDQVVPLLASNKRVRRKLNELLESYIEMIESSFEDDADPDMVEQELVEKIATFQANYQDKHWLCNWVQEFDLALLSEIIGEELFPQKTWDLIENEDRFVVVDEERTMVLDLANFDKLSGLGSMANVGDPEALKDRKAVAEVIRLREESIARDTRACEIIHKQLADFYRAEGLLEFPRRR